MKSEAPSLKSAEEARQEVHGHLHAKSLNTQERRRSLKDPHTAAATIWGWRPCWGRGACAIALAVAVAYQRET